MSLLLDTHILLWWYLDRPELPERYAKLLETAEQNNEDIHVSIMTLWEIAKLVHLGKIEISFSLDQWFQELAQEDGLQILPLSPTIILESNRLGENFHRDPSDQLIAATARCHGLRLMTVDQKIIQSKVVAIA